MQDNMKSVTFKNSGKNVVVAYLLWWFLGFLGIHKFYLEKNAQGVTYLLLMAAQFVLFFVGIGAAGLGLMAENAAAAISGGGIVFLSIAMGGVQFLYWIFDAFLIPKYTESYNQSRGIHGSSFGVNVQGSKSMSENLENLEKLSHLRKTGAITEEEFLEMKHKIAS